MKTIKDIAQEMYPVENNAECYTAFLEGAEHGKRYACEHDIPSSPMTIQQKQEWLKTRKPLTIVAKPTMIEDAFGVLYYTLKSYDYFYKNHIDIRGLIPMGLAIDATNLNIY